ncbi:phage tail protein [Tenacibaculum ovolyticum]|uniref:phage tail protein n=1 Tax=Tenacibaculum ovolyticum TaxID=104270 RepID=UPI0007EC9B1C|nr:tail fiber protein [Tenacibaculum ovolyticum]
MDPFLGQIVLFGGNFAPRGWALCEGQLLPISQYNALFAILGTIYGGDGRTTFALPDLRGRAAISSGRGPGLSDRRLGSRSGQEVHTLTTLEMPSHNHLTQNTNSADQHIILSSSNGVNETPQSGDVPAVGNYTSGVVSKKTKNFGPPTAGNAVNGQAISGNAGLTILNNGGNQPHNNMQPYLTTNYIIALQGQFPSRN